MAKEDQIDMDGGSWWRSPETTRTTTTRHEDSDGRVWYDTDTYSIERLATRADANTDWLRGCVELDRKGFVVTGTELPPGTAETGRWRSVGRAPFLLETSLPGVFAAGDVRSASVKRCGTAVGEGAMAVSFVHAHIARPA